MPKNNPYNKAPRMMGKDFRMMDQKLRAIVQDLKSLEEDWSSHQRNLEIWLRHRRETIMAMRQVAKELDQTHRNANVAHCAGGGLMGIGALVEIFGAIMDLNNCENAADVRKAGRTCAGIGVATSAVASGIEGGLTMFKVCQLKSMLREDQELLEEIVPFFVRSEKVEAALKAIFQIGFDCEVQGKVAIVAILKVCKDASISMIDVVRALIDIGYDIDSGDFKSFVNVTLPKLFNTCQEIFSDERLRGSLESISESLIRAPIVIERVQLCVRALSFFSGVNVTEKLSLAVVARLDISPEFVPWFSAVAVSLTKTAVIAYKVFSIIDTIEKIVNCVPSEFSKAIRDLSEHMSEELNQIAGTQYLTGKSLANAPKYKFP